MAKRFIYVSPSESKKKKVQKIEVNFEWFPGFAFSQKQKSIESMHKNAFKFTGIALNEFLEVSTKSKNKLGRALSAFNLKTKTIIKGIEFSVESAYQSGKVFSRGGPYIDILKLPSREAKKDPRLRNSGELLYFAFYGRRFELEYGSGFYDWLYINVLLKNPNLCKEVMRYRVFTDIEFNPKKSLSTQAHSVALFVAMKRANVEDSELIDYELFLEKRKEFVY